MYNRWQRLAQRIVQGLDVQPSELILIQDNAGCLDLLLEILLTIELMGATPLPQIAPAQYIEQVWTNAPSDYLRNWDQHRARWLYQVDRVLVLTAAEPAFARVPQDALAAWEQADLRLTRIQEERRLPFLLVAVPTELRARQLGLTFEALGELLLPAMDISVVDLNRQRDCSTAVTLVSRSSVTIEHRADGVLHP
jgi:leucyl aminopeptidase (aminopeptidase T)